jgi:hypothetical protein
MVTCLRKTRKIPSFSSANPVPLTDIGRTPLLFDAGWREWRLERYEATNVSGCKSPPYTTFASLYDRESAFSA